MNLHDLRYVAVSNNAKKILLDRYVLKTASGHMLEHGFEDVMRRVARTVASKLVEAKVVSIDELQDTEVEFYNLLVTRVFLPNSPTIFNFGKGVDIELFHKSVYEMTTDDYEKVCMQSENKRNMGSACFVQDIDDSMDNIFQAVHDAAITQKYGGGVGFNFSKLRPSNAPVGGTSGLASGPISFMHVINHATEAVDQGGVR